MGVSKTEGSGMTMTDTIGAVLAPIIQRGAPSRPTLRRVIDQIVLETGVRRNEARAFAMSTKSGIENTLARGETRWYMSEAWLGRYHHILEAIAPDGVRSSVDSAHGLLERFALDPAKGQLGLVHGKHERTWQRDGTLHCTYDICIDAVPVP